MVLSWPPANRNAHPVPHGAKIALLITFLEREMRP
jgi:hypothetical protein